MVSLHPPATGIIKALSGGGTGKGRGGEPTVKAESEFHELLQCAYVFVSKLFSSFKTSKRRNKIITKGANKLGIKTLADH